MKKIGFVETQEETPPSSFSVKTVDVKLYKYAILELIAR